MVLAVRSLPPKLDTDVTDQIQMNILHLGGHFSPFLFFKLMFITPQKLMIKPEGLDLV